MATTGPKGPRTGVGGGVNVPVGIQRSVFFEEKKALATVQFVFHSTLCVQLVGGCGGNADSEQGDIGRTCN